MKRIILIAACVITVFAVPAFALQKNVTSQKWTVFAFNTTTNAPVTGGAAAITGTVYIDGVSNAIDDTNPTELGGGYYEFDLAQPETNGNHITMVAASSTTNVVVVGKPAVYNTVPPAWNTLGIANGYANANIKQISDDATAADNAELMYDGTGYAGGAVKLGVDVASVSGDTTAADTLELAFDGTKVSLASIFSDAMASADLDAAITANASVAAILDDTGTSGVVVAASSKTGYSLAADQAVNVTKIAGSAVGTTSAQIGVNVVNWKGSAAPAMTGDAYARLGAPVGASVSADVAAVKADTAAAKTAAEKIDTSTELRTLLAGSDTPLATASNQTSIINTLGAAGAGLTAVPWNVAWATPAQAASAAALTAYDPPTNAELTTGLSAVGVDENAIAAAVFATTIDGTAFSKIVEMVKAWLSGKATVTPAASTSTITYYKADNTTESYSIVPSNTNGSRASGGTIN